MLNQIPENVVLLRKNNNNVPKTPFFCIHPVTGIGDQVYLPLANQLKDDRDFYAISSTILADFTVNNFKNSTVTKSIDQLAHEYIQFIRKIQPKGPYCLGGFSFGGLVAFHMAALLEKPYDEGGYNEKVAFLGIFDTAFMNMNLWDKTTLANHLVATLEVLIENHQTLNVEYLKQDELVRFNSKEDIIRAAFTKIKMQFNDISINEVDTLTKAVNQAKQLKEILNATMHHILAAANYEINEKNKVNEITLFVATEVKTVNNEAFSTILNDTQSLNDWQKHSIKPIRVLPIKANHFNIIENQYLAERLEEYLRAIDNNLIAGNVVQQIINLLSSFKQQKELIELFEEQLIQSSGAPEVAILLEAATKKNLQQQEQSTVNDVNVNYALRPANQPQHIISKIPPHRIQNLCFNFGNNNQQPSRSSLTIHKLPANDTCKIANSSPSIDKVYF